MLTEKDFCDYDTCVALKELGYNRGAYAYYFPNHKEDLIFNTHQMRGCSINEMLKGYNTYPKDVMGHELIDAPTMWEAQKWLREIHNIFVMIDRSFAASNSWHYVICANDDFEHLIEQPSLENYSYEEALSEGIKEAVKILKENNMEGCKCKPAKSYAERIIEYREFVSLVKRMREAQKEGRKWEIVNFKTEEDKVAYGNAIRRMYQLEFKVDEYLKKMER